MSAAHPNHPGAAFSRFLDDEAEALAGYPVRVLLQAWLTPRFPGDVRLDTASGQLMHQVLQRWTSSLSRQVSAMAPAGSLAVEQWRQRTCASHRALLQLQRMVEQALASQAGAGVGPPCAMPAVADAAWAPDDAPARPGP